MDPSLQKALLQDPKVQDAVRKAGNDALSDPKVQELIIATCKEKFPEMASAASKKVLEWGNDPEVQKQAKQLAGVAIVYAGQAAGQAGEQFVRLIEQGPAGVRLLAFFGALASCINAGRTVINPLELVSGAFVGYVLATYQSVFSITTMLFEAQPEWIQKVPGLNQYQNLVLEKAKFLSEVLGRGLFYGFQGTLWLSCGASLSRLVELSLGGYFIMLAAFHILMHFGVMPQHVARKLREGGVLDAAATSDGYGYMPVGAGAPFSAVEEEFLAAAPSQQKAQEAIAKEQVVKKELAPAVKETPKPALVLAPKVEAPAAALKAALESTPAPVAAPPASAPAAQAGETGNADPLLPQDEKNEIKASKQKCCATM